MTDGEWDRFWNGMDGRSTGEGSPASRSSDEEHAPDLEDDDDDDTIEEAERPSRPWPMNAGAMSAAALLGSHAMLLPGMMLQAHAKSRGNSRSSRCGMCVGCRARDCGSCKNCLDKPRFGGPGIKKKACLSRICRSANNREAESSDQKDSDHDEKAALDPLGSTERLDPKDETPGNGWPAPSQLAHSQHRPVQPIHQPLAPLAPLAHPASMPMAMSPMSAGAEPSNPHCHMSQLAALHALGDSARRQPLLPLEMRHEMRVMMPSVT